jgi:hypothetical protein
MGTRLRIANCYPQAMPSLSCFSPQLAAAIGVLEISRAAQQSLEFSIPGRHVSNRSHAVCLHAFRFFAAVQSRTSFGHRDSPPDEMN